VAGLLLHGAAGPWDEITSLTEPAALVGVAMLAVTLFLLGAAVALLWPTSRLDAAVEPASRTEADPRRDDDRRLREGDRNGDASAGARRARANRARAKRMDRWQH
jgi:hypothetical protein